MARRATSIVTAILAVIAVAGCSTANDESAIAKSTSRVAGAGVVGMKRAPGVVCAPMTAADPSPQGEVRSLGYIGVPGVVPSDPKRIVVLDTSTLDAACGVGMWERVVGAPTLTQPDIYGFSHPQPRYLGEGVDKIASIGTNGGINLDKIKALHPDLIIGVQLPKNVQLRELNTIAPTVLTGGQLGWKKQFVVAGGTMGRLSVARDELDRYERQAQRLANDLVTSQTQASVVEFDLSKIEVVGTETFAGSVLIDAGVQRPPGQRGPSHPGNATDPRFAEGDCIYVMFADHASQVNAEETMHSDAWTDLGASKDRRVFAVDRQIWDGNGIIAARAMLDDLRESLNGAVYD